MHCLNYNNSPVSGGKGSILPRLAGRPAPVPSGPNRREKPQARGIKPDAAPCSGQQTGQTDSYNLLPQSFAGRRSPTAARICRSFAYPVCMRCAGLPVSDPILCLLSGPGYWAGRV
ncbi:uncharacterized protein B0H64DRAFT_147913 [Chaetomium fimeti]|uniref:Uncharacterized protein n=1 Tax=Chaetomium fimeti TaxID=1854472 RepID=A0AAE0LS70_9PEZI|nr:hypothetical protein B0H64DRAFT_147913 [Chaetomium fimeti]